MSTDPALEHVVRTIADTAVAREKEFGDLDAVVGDGDFGYSLARGFENVIADWDLLERSASSTFLQKVAVTLTKRLGGTSGPIWGTAFLRAATAAKEFDPLTGDTAVAMLRSAIEGIKARGRSDVGDKTLLDALVPLTDALEAAVAEGVAPAEVAHRAAAAARSAAEATAQMQARRGRASYTGERSIGSVDAGAMAVAIMAEEIAVSWPTD
jgi:dihydroxyacetone kinase-like protein